MEMVRVSDMGGILGVRGFADLAESGKWDRQSEVSSGREGLRARCVKSMLFQNPLLEFAFLELVRSNKVVLYQEDEYHTPRKHKGWGVEFLVIEEGWNNRIGRFVGTGVRDWLLGGRGEIDGNGLVVAAGVLGDE